MSAEPTHAPVTYLESVPSPPRPAQATTDQALTELALALDTERSANKAMVEAVKGMDRMLAEQRQVNAELTAKAEQMESQLAEYATAVTQQVADNKRLWCEVRLAEHRLEEELDKPGWRRLLRR